MSNYPFAPSPNFGLSEHPFTTWEGGFSSDVVDEIIRICESRSISRAGVGTENKDISTLRRSNVAWLDLQEDSRWIYDKVAFIIRNLNGQYYNFDVHGFVEDMQFTIYDGSENGHYDWHVDSGAANGSPRKLSFVLQLSDPSEYEGGDLQVFTSAEPVTVQKQKGFAIAIQINISVPIHLIYPQSFFNSIDTKEVALKMLSLEGDNVKLILGMDKVLERLNKTLSIYFSFSQ